MTHLLPTSLHNWRSLVGVLLAIIFCLDAGCQSWFSRKKKEEDSQFVKDTKRIQELMSDPDRPRLIGEVAGLSGIEVKVYESFGLVTGLPGTGGRVKPSEQRNIMLAEMRVRSVDKPEMVLDDPSTALTKVRVFGNPGYLAGQILDVGVEISTECEATNLAGGNLLETKLREMAFVGGKLRSGSDQAVASGELVILPASFTKRNVDPLSASIIGGGRLMNTHPLSVLMLPEYKHVMMVKAIEQALNKRFYFGDSYKQKYVAEGKNSAQISITTLPKYRLDPAHFSNVILSTGFNENENDRTERLAGCRELLKNRATARRAAAELEALGNAGAVDALLEGLSSLDTEIRFYSAYSLAYLDRKESIPVLTALAKSEPAFRPLCLIGLTINDQEAAREALENLLHETESEVRFGAYWAIRQRNLSDMRVQGEKLTETTQLVIVPSANSMLAVSLQEKPELVLFGTNASVDIPNKLTPTSSLTIAPIAGKQLRLTRRAYGETANAVVESSMLSLLRGLGAVGASYNDIVQTLDVLVNGRMTSIPIEFNPRPRAGRIFKRDSQGESLSLVSLDASSRTKQKSSWSWLKWPQWSTAKSAPLAESEKPQIDRRSPTDMPSHLDEKRLSKGFSESLGESELPEIDWDALK